MCEGAKRSIINYNAETDCYDSSSDDKGTVLEKCGVGVPGIGVKFHTIGDHRNVLTQPLKI